MKTPIQMAIEHFQQVKSDRGKVNDVISLNTVIDELSMFLRQEKQQIIDAYEDARPDESDFSGDDYFRARYQ